MVEADSQVNRESIKTETTEQETDAEQKIRAPLDANMFSELVPMDLNSTSVPSEDPILSMSTEAPAKDSVLSSTTSHITKKKEFRLGYERDTKNAEPSNKTPFNERDISDDIIGLEANAGFMENSFPVSDSDHLTSVTETKSTESYGARPIESESLVDKSKKIKREAENRFQKLESTEEEQFRKVVLHLQKLCTDKNRGKERKSCSRLSLL